MRGTAATEPSGWLSCQGPLSSDTHDPLMNLTLRDDASPGKHVQDAPPMCASEYCFVREEQQRERLPETVASRRRPVRRRIVGLGNQRPPEEKHLHDEHVHDSRMIDQTPEIPERR